MKNLNQNGIAQVLVLLLLVLGVGISTYLVQQRTNILPFAAEGGSCRSDPMGTTGSGHPNKDFAKNVNLDNYCKEGATWSYKWEADCSSNCSTNSDCPGGVDGQKWCYQFSDGNRCMKLTDNGAGLKDLCQGKGPGSSGSSNSSSQPKSTGGNPSIDCSVHPSGINTPDAKTLPGYDKDKDTWQYIWEANCKASCDKNSDCPQNKNNSAVEPKTSNWCYQFKNDNRCMMLTTTDKAEGEDKSKSPGAEAAPGGSGPGSAGSSEVCKEATTNNYYDAKVATRLTRYYAILKGVPKYCVHADLGVGDQIKADSKDGSVKGGRLFLCSTSESKPDNLDLVFMVPKSDNSDLIEAQRDKPSGAQIPEDILKHVDEAEKKAGVK